MPCGCDYDTLSEIFLLLPEWDDNNNDNKIIGSAKKIPIGFLRFLKFIPFVNIVAGNNYLHHGVIQHRITVLS
jgi:hypothetical protein